jgi:hypothetical protein
MPPAVGWLTERTATSEPQYVRFDHPDKPLAELESVDLVEQHTPTSALHDQVDRPEEYAVCVIRRERSILRRA